MKTSTIVNSAWKFCCEGSREIRERVMGELGFLFFFLKMSYTKACLGIDRSDLVEKET